MPTQFMVRPYRATDLDRLLQIERASFGADAYDRKLFAEFFHNCGELFLVVVSEGRVCGYMVTCTRGNRAEVVSVAVARRFRRQGAASSLMRNTLRRLQSRGATGVSLMVRISNKTARAFYEGHGFRKLRRVPAYYADGEDGWLMNKRVGG